MAETVIHKGTYATARAVVHAPRDISVRELIRALEGVARQLRGGRDVSEKSDAA